MLTKPPILRMPDTMGMFRLMSDTSILATGGVLYQFQDNDFYIVGYNSKKLQSAVKKIIPSLNLNCLVLLLTSMLSKKLLLMSILNVIVTIQL